MLGVSCGCGFSPFPFVSLDHILSDADTSIPLCISVDGHLDCLQFGVLTLPGFINLFIFGCVGSSFLCEGFL